MVLKQSKKEDSGLVLVVLISIEHKALGLSTGEVMVIDIVGTMNVCVTLLWSGVLLPVPPHVLSL